MAPRGSLQPAASLPPLALSLLAILASPDVCPPDCLALLLCTSYRLPLSLRWGPLLSSHCPILLIRSTVYTVVCPSNRADPLNH